MILLAIYKDYNDEI